MESMSMSMSMSHMPSATSSPSSTSGSMSMDNGMMGMDSMMMVFFSATNTPLYSSSWMPSGAGSYAGTCIFLIALAVLFRCLLAIRCNFLPLLAWFAHRRKTSVLQSDFKEKYEVKAFSSLAAERRPWRINEALLRAGLDTVLAGVSYLLMLAVMTMNVGYFASVLAGTFLGSFIVGGFSGASAH